MALKHLSSGTPYSQTKLFHFDNTGLYDATGNSTGWGSGSADPNPDLSEVADIGSTKGIVILLETPSGNYSWDDTLAIQARGWPNASNTKLVLEASTFGLEKFPDGKITVTSRVSGEYTYFDGLGDITEGFSAQSSYIMYNTEQVKCCVEKLALAITAENKVGFCENPSVKLFNKADVMLQRIIHAADHGNYNEADEHLALLKELCAEGGHCGC